MKIWRPGELKARSIVVSVFSRPNRRSGVLIVSDGVRFSDRIRLRSSSVIFGIDITLALGCRIGQSYHRLRPVDVYLGGLSKTPEGALKAHVLWYECESPQRLSGHRRGAPAQCGMTLSMALLVANCPRCRAERMTFDVPGAIPTIVQYDWRIWYEVFCVCRNCDRSTTFVIALKSAQFTDIFRSDLPTKINGSLNDYFDIDSYISVKDFGAEPTPDHVPETVATAFREGAVSLRVGNWNAAGTMFRLAIDLTTRPMLPPVDTSGLNKRTRRDLGLRL